jgi:F-type H+-transporting ATPase subunit b
MELCGKVGGAVPLIDYFTTFAQIANFLVLIVLLKHFLAGPVVRSMDEREKRLLSRSNEAEQKKKEAQDEAQSYQKMKQELLDRQIQDKALVEEKARALRSNLEEKARAEVEAEKSEWLKSIERQKSDLIEKISRSAGESAQSIARRALKDLADANLEEEMIETFLRRLNGQHGLSDAEKNALYEFSRDSGGKITVRSSFEISSQMRQRIEDAVLNLAGGRAAVEFEVDRGLISGIELSAKSIRISWSIEAYLDDLKKDLLNALDEKISP